MNIDALVACLQELERLNVRQVGSYVYELSRLSNAVPLPEAVAQELASRGKYQERFPVELSGLQGSWRLQVEELVEQWVFGGLGRPNDGNGSTSLAQKLSEQLVQSFPDYSVYTIIGEGTMLPAEIWNALALTNGRENWMLEFGWSD